MTRPFDIVDPQELWEQTVSEAVFQTRVIHLAHENQFETYHHTTTGGKCRQCGARVSGGRIVTSKGFPDLVLGRQDPSRLIYAELKSQNGRVSPDQVKWRRILEACGQEYYLWRPSNWEEIERVLEGRDGR